MAKLKQVKVIQTKAKKQTGDIVGIVCKTPVKKAKCSKSYDLSSRARLIIVDGNLQKQDVALAVLRKEMSEIVRSVSPQGYKSAKGENASMNKLKKEYS